MNRIEKHEPKDCPFVHIKKCKGCGRSCACYTMRGSHFPLTKKQISSAGNSFHWALRDLVSAIEDENSSPIGMMKAVIKAYDNAKEVLGKYE